MLDMGTWWVDPDVEYGHMWVSATGAKEDTAKNSGRDS